MRKERKREHKKVIAYMRRVNKQIETDEYLGLNRFRVDCFSEQWKRFYDGSGGIIIIIFKLSDKSTGNTAYFVADNWNYKREISEYANDFLIRCSSCRTGHFPRLSYAAYNIHTIEQYDGEKGRRELPTPEDGVINTYSWINGVEFD